MKSERSYSSAGYLKENYHYFHLRDTAGQERDFHFHEFDKLVLLISGRVDYSVESESYRLKPWDILLVRHHTIHKALIDKSEPYERVIIYLDRRYFDRVLPGAELMRAFDRADSRRRHLLTPGEEERRRIEEILRGFESEQRAGESGAGAMCETYVMQLLLLAGRMAETAPEQGERVYDAKLERALSYINENLSRELSVDELADSVFLSRYHFMRLFKAQTGSTVHAYIRQKRLLNAARMIREGVSAAKAAEDSGFSDYSTFHRAFKESFGVSPGQLKK